jgi:hypothetical protein
VFGGPRLADSRVVPISTLTKPRRARFSEQPALPSVAPAAGYVFWPVRDFFPKLWPSQSKFSKNKHGERGTREFAAAI